MATMTDATAMIFITMTDATAMILITTMTDATAMILIATMTDGCHDTDHSFCQHYSLLTLLPPPPTLDCRRAAAPRCAKWPRRAWVSWWT